MVLTVYFALSPVTGLCCHRRPQETCKKLASRELDTSVGVSGPHDFAVRANVIRPRATARLTCRVHRIPHPTSVTIAKRPSGGDGMAVDVEVIWVKREQEYFYRKGWTDKWVICPSGKSPISIARAMNSVGPAAVPTRVPTKSWPANHADRSNNDRTGHHDHGFVGVATTTPATMFAAAATAGGLGTNACEAQQSGKCRNRKNFSAHYLSPSLVFASRRQVWPYTGALSPLRKD